MCRHPLAGPSLKARSSVFVSVQPSSR